MEDVILTVMIGAAGGASGNLISNYADRSIFWLRDKFQNHNEIAQQKAAENSLVYLKQLGDKVQKLEERSTKDYLTLNQALEEPDTSLLLQKSLIAASTTSNPLKHALLSDLIEKRLESNSEDYSSLIANQACDAIGSLSSDHIKILSILTGIYFLKPEVHQINITRQAYESAVINYINSICKCVNTINTVNAFSFKHLEGMSCLSISIGSSDLFKIISAKVESNDFEVTTDHFNTLDWWSKFIEAWDNCMCHAELTSTGIFIGSLAIGQISGLKVDLKL